MTTPLIEACAMRLYDGLRPDHALPWDACERAVCAVIPLVLQHAANICGSLAETAYDDAEGFAAATGCEAAIVAEIARMEAQS